MRDRQNRDLFAKSNEHNFVGEAVYGQGANIGVFQAGHYAARERKAFKVFKHLSHFCGETRRDLLVAVTVPPDRLTKFAFRVRSEANPPQRDSTSR